MNWINNIEKIVWKSLAFLPCFFTITNYFTVLKPDQRNQPIGWMFLIFSIVYFLICLVLLVMNWGK